MNFISLLVTLLFGLIALAAGNSIFDRADFNFFKGLGAETKLTAKQQAGKLTTHR